MAKTRRKKQAFLKENKMKEQEKDEKKAGKKKVCAHRHSCSCLVRWTELAAAARGEVAAVATVRNIMLRRAAGGIGGEVIDRIRTHTHSHT